MTNFGCAKYYLQIFDYLGTSFRPLHGGWYADVPIRKQTKKKLQEAFLNSLPWGSITQKMELVRSSGDPYTPNNKFWYIYILFFLCSTSTRHLGVKETYVILMSSQRVSSRYRDHDFIALPFSKRLKGKNRQFLKNCHPVRGPMSFSAKAKKKKKKGIYKIKDKHLTLSYKNYLQKRGLPP